MRAIGVLSLLPALGGCIAAAIPIAASSAIVGKKMSARRGERQVAPAPARPAAQTVTVDGQTVRVLTGMTQLPRPDGTMAPPVAPASGPRPDAVSETMQYLYGSGESAALSTQAYRGLSRYLLDIVTYGKKGKARQLVLNDGASLDAPQFDACGAKPLAVVLDIDETALLNLGYEADAATRGGGYDADRWARWEATGADKVAAVPGAKMALDAARDAGVTVIFNSNRLAATADQTERALDYAGLGPAKHGTTLWLKGDGGGGSGKDGRRRAIALTYCVVALVGDQLGDFSDLFNQPALTTPARRALAGSSALASLWGNGWFVLPNPVYGTALKGGVDDVFPANARWTDPGPPPAARTATGDRR